MSKLVEMMEYVNLTSKKFSELCGHPERTISYWRTKKCPPNVLWAINLYIENRNLKKENENILYAENIKLKEENIKLKEENIKLKDKIIVRIVEN